MVFIPPCSGRGEIAAPADDISRTGAKPSGEALMRFRIVAGRIGQPVRPSEQMLLYYGAL